MKMTRKTKAPCIPPPLLAPSVVLPALEWEWSESESTPPTSSVLDPLLSESGKAEVVKVSDSVKGRLSPGNDDDGVAEGMRFQPSGKCNVKLYKFTNHICCSL